MNYFKNKVFKRFERLNLDKIRKKKYNDYLNLPYEIVSSYIFKSRLGDKKFYKYYKIWDNWHIFFLNDLIDEEGKVKKDKKCEYKFTLREILSSSIPKVNFIYALVILAFLF